MVIYCLKPTLAKAVDCVQSASNVVHSTLHEVKLCFRTCKMFMLCLRPRLGPQSLLPVVTVEKTLAEFVYVCRHSDY